MCVWKALKCCEVAATARLLTCGVLVSLPTYCEQLFVSVRFYLRDCDTVVDAQLAHVSAVLIYRAVERLFFNRVNRAINYCNRALTR